MVSHQGVSQGVTRHRGMRHSDAEKCVLYMSCVTCVTCVTHLLRSLVNPTFLGVTHEACVKGFMRHHASLQRGVVTQVTRVTQVSKVTQVTHKRKKLRTTFYFIPM